MRFYNVHVFLSLRIFQVLQNQIIPLWLKFLWLEALLKLLVRSFVIIFSTAGSLTLNVYVVHVGVKQIFTKFFELN